MNFRLTGLKDCVLKKIGAWKSFYDVSNPHEIPMPEPFDKIKGLQRLVALRCIRPDKVVPAVQVNYKSIFIELWIICYAFGFCRKITSRSRETIAAAEQILHVVGASLDIQNVSLTCTYTGCLIINYTILTSEIYG